MAHGFCWKKICLTEINLDLKQQRKNKIRLSKDGYVGLPVAITSKKNIKSLENLILIQKKLMN